MLGAGEQLQQKSAQQRLQINADYVDKKTRRQFAKA
jgi:hypothetical protein